MVKSQTLFEAQAREAAARIEAARDAGEQLALPLPDEAPEAGGARRGRGAGRAGSMLRQWAADRGFRMPEDALAEMAGLASREDVFLAAMQRTEQVLAWAQGEHGRATAAQRLDVFKLVFTSAIRAAEALLPYGLAKVTPDAGPVQATQINVYAGAQGSGQAGGQAGAQGGAGAVQGAPQQVEARPVAPRLAPPPMPHQIQQNQGLADAAPVHSDGAIRTDGASDWKGKEK